MASQKAKQGPRRRRKPGAPSRAVTSSRRDEREQRRAQAARELSRGSRQAAREGERPEGLFGPLPVSELAMLIGVIALVIGFLNGGGPVVIVGLVIIALGVLEVTAREHFTGYRSHSTLLAAIPAVALEAAVVGVVGAPSQRALLIVFVAPVFAVLFWWLRHRFTAARQARVAAHARPSAPAGL
ncbi:MAG: hypothetical protein M3022_19725 [Actinomycetota bacterium]|nr:hypothetical protein [Actinomycetota bacterium]